MGGFVSTTYFNKTKNTIIDLINKRFLSDKIQKQEGNSPDYFLRSLNFN